MHWYVRVLANQPYWILLITGALATIAIALSLTLKDLPDFSNPQDGFESRGTEISDKLTTWTNLLDSVSHVGPLITNPNLGFKVRERKQKKKRKNGGRKKNKGKQETRRKRDIDIFKQFKDPDLRSTEHNVEKRSYLLYNRNAWLCGDPVADYVHVVYESTRDQSLFTLRSIQSMCRLESVYFKNQKQFSELCETKGPAECCPGWSLGGYIALLHNRTSCFTIQESDVANTLELAKQCYPHYVSGALTGVCASNYVACQGVPAPCVEHNAIFTILHFLTDQNFLSVKGEGMKLKYAMSFLPLARSTAMMPLYTSLDGVEIRDSTTRIVAMDLGIKDSLFNKYLLEDANFLFVAVALIFISVWVFTNSLTITFAALSSILFAILTAYFIYTCVFNLQFFPFMNVLAIIITLGVGTDDTFILCKVWNQSLRSFKVHEKTPSLEELVSMTLQHASFSMLVTSLTTAAAFFGSVVSSITAIRCFSIFAGLTIIMNFILMVTWVPAWIILHYQIMTAQVLHRRIPVERLETVFTKSIEVYSKFTGCVTKFFDKILPVIIIKPRVLWIILLGFGVIISFVLLFVPGLRLPDSDQLQLLKVNHPLELYDLKFRNKFNFEESYQKQFNLHLPLRFVWGALVEDNGDHLNPGDTGLLEMDPGFDISSREAQTWLYKFCQELRRQPFYESRSNRLQLSNCFIQTFKDWMARPCYNDLSQETHRPCCRESVFPYHPDIFNQCIQLAVEDLYETPSDLWLPGVAGPKFNLESRNISAIIIEFPSKYMFSFRYSEMKEFYTTVDTWFKDILQSAPEELKRGFFTSYLEFYDLQHSLLQGTYISILVAMTVSFLVLLLATQNLLLSGLAILTVASIILVTVAILLLIGWELNILESVVVTLAIGLSVDFTLHYGIMYTLSVDTDREKCVLYSISSVGSPVSMAAITTAIAGLCLLPSRVLAYIQIGTFLCILMTVSWIFSTIFFQAILVTFGPQHKKTFQFPPKVQEFFDKYLSIGQPEGSNQKQAYTLSESVLSQVSNSSISFKMAESPQKSTNGTLFSTSQTKGTTSVAGMGKQVLPSEPPASRLVHSSQLSQSRMQTSELGHTRMSQAGEHTMMAGSRMVRSGELVKSGQHTVNGSRGLHSIETGIVRTAPVDSNTALITSPGACREQLRSSREHLRSSREHLGSIREPSEIGQEPPGAFRDRQGSIREPPVGFKKKRCLSYSKPGTSRGSYMRSSLQFDARSKSFDLAETLMFDDGEELEAQDPDHCQPPDIDPQDNPFAGDQPFREPHLQTDEALASPPPTFQQQDPVEYTVTTTVATLHTDPRRRKSVSNSKPVSPSRKSLCDLYRDTSLPIRCGETALFVSDGWTIRTDPHHLQTMKSFEGSSSISEFSATLDPFNINTSKKTPGSLRSRHCTPKNPLPSAPPRTSPAPSHTHTPSTPRSELELYSNGFMPDLPSPPKDLVLPTEEDLVSYEAKNDSDSFIESLDDFSIRTQKFEEILLDPVKQQHVNVGENNINDDINVQADDNVVTEDDITATGENEDDVDYRTVNDDDIDEGTVNDEDIDEGTVNEDDIDDTAENVTISDTRMVDEEEGDDNSSQILKQSPKSTYSQKDISLESPPLSCPIAPSPRPSEDSEPNSTNSCVRNCSMPDSATVSSVSTSTPYQLLQNNHSNKKRKPMPKEETDERRPKSSLGKPRKSCLVDRRPRSSADMFADDFTPSSADSPAPPYHHNQSDSCSFDGSVDLTSSVQVSESIGGCSSEIDLQTVKEIANEYDPAPPLPMRTEAGSLSKPEERLEVCLQPLEPRYQHPTRNLNRMYERDGDLLDSGECGGLSNLSLGPRDNVQYPQLVIDPLTGEIIPLSLLHADLGMHGGDLLTPISDLTTPIHGDLPGHPGLQGLAPTPMELNIMPDCRSGHLPVTCSGGDELLDIMDPKLIMAQEPIYVKESATGRLKPVYPRLEPLDRLQHPLDRIQPLERIQQPLDRIVPRDRLQQQQQQPQKCSISQQGYVTVSDARSIDHDMLYTTSLPPPWTTMPRYTSAGNHHSGEMSTATATPLTSSLRSSTEKSSRKQENRNRCESNSYHESLPTSSASNNANKKQKSPKDSGKMYKSRHNSQKQQQPQQGYDCCSKQQQLKQQHNAEMAKQQKVPHHQGEGSANNSSDIQVVSHKSLKSKSLKHAKPKKCDTMRATSSGVGQQYDAKQASSYEFRSKTMDSRHSRTQDAKGGKPGKPLKKRGSLKSMYDGQAGNIGAINEYAWKDLRHPLSRSTETILFDKDDANAEPIVPNRKSGTPDVWLPRSIKA